MMKHPFLRQDHTLGAADVFRVASLFLYIVLLVYVAVAAAAQRLQLNEFSGIAVGALLFLFIASLGRFVWPHALACSQSRQLTELAVAVAVVGLLVTQRALPSLPSSWLIGITGVFLLLLQGGFAVLAMAGILGACAAMNLYLGGPLADWLPHVYAVLFVGALSHLLGRALNSKLASLQQVELNQRRFDAIARATRHVFMIVDANYQVKYVNPAIQEITGFTEEECKQLTLKATNHPDDEEEHRRKLRYLRNTPRSSIFSRHRTRHKNGRWIWVEACGYNMLHDPAINGLVFSIEDITARKEAERRLAEDHALLRAVLDNNPSMIYAKDAEGRYTISNLSYQRRFGYSSEDGLRGKTTPEVFLQQSAGGHELKAWELAQRLHQEDLQVMQSGEALIDQETQGVWESDAGTWYRTNKYPLRDAGDRVIGVLGITRDVTDRKEYEMRLEHQALHDPLTGLPNRRFVLKMLADAIVDFRERQRKLAIVFCDLDFFKSVNELHGHEFGDKCLLELTRRIAAEVPTQDFVARFGGNEFVVLANADLNEAKRRAEAMLQAVAQPLLIDDVVVKIQASIGIAQLHARHKSPSDLIRDVDAAMFKAKERGRNRIEIFDTELQLLTSKRAQLDVALRFALERDELMPMYQPKVLLEDGSVQGFELLLRWDHPEYGAIAPTEFIPIAESSGLIVPIGRWALEQACQQISVWRGKFPDQKLTIAVNVSMRQLLQPAFVSEITGILRRTGIPPAAIELELTETSAMADPLQTVETLTQLKKLGVRLALDDFGTGYSSLAYLQKLPLDVLKIDQAFIRGLAGDSSDAEIVRLILALAQTLNLETVAEGVESETQIAVLRRLGCRLGQGYAFSPSVDAAGAERLLRPEPPAMMAGW